METLQVAFVRVCEDFFLYFDGFFCHPFKIFYQCFSCFWHSLEFILWYLFGVTWLTRWSVLLVVTWFNSCVCIGSKLCWSWIVHSTQHLTLVGPGVLLVLLSSNVSMVHFSTLVIFALAPLVFFFSTHLNLCHMLVNLLRVHRADFCWWTTTKCRISDDIPDVFFRWFEASVNQSPAAILAILTRNCVLRLAAQERETPMPEMNQFMFCKLTDDVFSYGLLSLNDMEYHFSKISNQQRTCGPATLLQTDCFAFQTCDIIWDFDICVTVHVTKCSGCFKI